MGRKVERLERKAAGSQGGLSSGGAEAECWRERGWMGGGGLAGGIWYSFSDSSLERTLYSCY